MARSDRLFKQAYNDCLDLIASGGDLASIAGLARQLGTSRTTVRRVVERLAEAGVTRGGKSSLAVARPTRRGDYFRPDETQSTEKAIETAFMRWVLAENIQPMTRLREAELSRQFGVSTSALREFLIRFSRFGLIRKEPQRYWVFEGFTKELALELSDVREMFELRAIGHLVELPDNHIIWNRILDLRDDHLTILLNIDSEFMNFPELDERFHRTINGAAENRFINDFQDLISMIFHYHYSWNKRFEKERNNNAVQEHIAYLDALIDRDGAKARDALRFHLETSRNTLMKAINW